MHFVLKWINLTRKIQNAKFLSLFKRVGDKRRIDRIETIIKRVLSEEFAGTYQTKGVCNEPYNRFEALPTGRIRWGAESTFRFHSLGMKLMRWGMPGAFKKQSMWYMENFERFAERKP